MIISNVNKTDTFFLYGEIMCVIEISQITTIHYDKILDCRYSKSFTEYVCQDVLNESCIVKYTETEILNLINNPEIYEAAA